MSEAMTTQTTLTNEHELDRVMFIAIRAALLAAADAIARRYGLDKYAPARKQVICPTDSIAG